MAAKDPTTRIFWLVALLVVAIALGSFALSYSALLALAIANGIPGWLAWIWPLIVDVSVIVFTGAILVSQLQRRGTKLAIALTGFYSIVTIAGNLLHAPGNWLGWFVAALPPVSLVFATEMLRAMAHHSILQHTAVVTLAELTAQVDTLTQQAGALTCQIDALKSNKATLTFGENTPKINTQVDTLNAARIDAKQERVNTLLSYLADNPQANLTEAAQVVDVSRQTVGKYVSELTSAGKLHRNGNGWEVIE